MSRTNYLTLIDRGRKAGLGTFELYTALGSRPREAGDPVGQADGNGYVHDYENNGRNEYHPLARSRPRSAG